MSLRQRLSKHDKKLETLPSACVEGLQRLRSGQAWLTNVQAQLETMPDYGVSSSLEAHFVRSMDGWADLERQVRFTYRYQGCIHGRDKECAPEATIRCEYCGDAAITHPLPLAV